MAKCPLFHGSAESFGNGCIVRNSHFLSYLSAGADLDIHLAGSYFNAINSLHDVLTSLRLTIGQNVNLTLYVE
jgi:hypothetical protein